jgi:broad specificity phosphatase PhoE
LSPGVAVPPGLAAFIVLLRHGDSTYVAEERFQGRHDPPLSDVGARQAALAGARLARPGASPALPIPPIQPLEIVHSPLERAAGTARAVATAVTVAGNASDAVPVRPDDGLTEIGQGEWEGLTAVAVSARWGDLLEAWRRDPVMSRAPGGEPLTDVAERVRPALERVVMTLAEQNSPAWTLLVGHDGVFKVALIELFGLPLDRFWTFSFPLCGISVVELRRGRAVLRAHGLTEHLAPLLDERAQAVAEARERSGAL